MTNQSRRRKRAKKAWNFITKIFRMGVQIIIFEEIENIGKNWQIQKVSRYNSNNQIFKEDYDAI